MKAQYIKEVIIIDPDSKGEVSVAIFKDETSGGMFGIDSSYLDQCFKDGAVIKVPSVFNKGKVVLMGLD